MVQDVQQAKQALVTYLLQRQATGEKRVYLSAEAKTVLRALYAEARNSKLAVRRQPTAAAPVPVPERVPTPARGLKPEVVPSELIGNPAVALSGYEQATVATARRVLRYEGSSKAEKLAYLKELIVEDEEVHMDTLLKIMVFSVGYEDAEIMFVGEAPGHDEEQKREPFVGPAGQLLTKIIGVMGLQRESVYISNICKFRPLVGPNQGTRNRKPTAEEMQACLPYIMAEIEIVQPKVIVALGATGAEGLTGCQEPVGRSRGRVRSWNGLPFVVTYHPSYLLRNTDLSERRKVWEDLLLVMEELKMPVSEKQRQFFKRSR